MWCRHVIKPTQHIQMWCFKMNDHTGQDKEPASTLMVWAISKVSWKIGCWSWMLKRENSQGKCEEEKQKRQEEQNEWGHYVMLRKLLSTMQQCFPPKADLGLHFHESITWENMRMLKNTHTFSKTHISQEPGVQQWAKSAFMKPTF